MKRLIPSIAALFTLIVSISCGSSGPTTPSETRIIQLPAEVDFGEITAGQPVDRTVRISNVGNAPLTIDGMVASQEVVEVFFTSLQTSRIIQPGDALDVLVQFRPLQARQYLGIANVTGNMTSGTNSFTIKGVGK